MMKEYKLKIELVPAPIQYINLRSLLPKEQWDKLRRATYKRVKYRCEICGGKGPDHPVECHEEWNYDEDDCVAKIVELHGLCPACHECKHVGLAGLNGRMEEVIAHLCKINGYDRQMAVRCISSAFEIWEQRSKWAWTIDVNVDYIQNLIREDVVILPLGSGNPRR